MTTAQDIFRAFLKDELGPLLRQMGFKGSGQTWTYPNEGCHALLGFQRSVSSDPQSVKFTANILVIEEKTWQDAIREAPHLGSERPSPNIFTGRGWQKRIGQLAPAGQDLWWYLTPDTDLAELAETVVSVVGNEALPAMIEQIHEQSEGV